jgi:hypothetical protein
MVQNNGDFTAKECQAAMKYPFLKGNSPKKISTATVALGNKRLSYSTSTNWVARFGTWHLGTEDKDCSGTTKQVTVPENVDAIHSMILDDQRISTTKTAETLEISQERVRYAIHKI